MAQDKVSVAAADVVVEDAVALVSLEVELAIVDVEAAAEETGGSSGIEFSSINSSQSA